MKPLLFIMALVCLAHGVLGQETNELQSKYDATSKELDSLKAHLKVVTAQADSLTKVATKLKDKITPFPRWKFGLFGTTGFNVSTFSDWLSKEEPSTMAINIGLSANGFMEIQQRKYFWKNAFNSNMGWLKFDDKDDPEDDTSFKTASDAFNVSSLFGWKITPKVALSVLGEYRTALLDGNFNNPGYLDLGGGGITWTPNADLNIVLHSLNFNWVFSEEGTTYDSSLGAKLLLDYTKEFNKKFSWKSNLSVFASYEAFKKLSNWTWTNSFSTTFKGIGVGAEFGLRGNKQEALAKGLENNPTQMYWIVGLTYGLSKTW